MKSIKIFFLSMLVLVAIYFVFDYYKSTYFLTKHHGLFIRLRTFTLIAGGIFAIYLSFNSKVFKLFLLYYGILWSLYIVFKIIQIGVAKLGMIQLAEHVSSIGYSYSNLTQLFSITPFVVFSCLYWLITSVLMVQRSNRKL